MAGDRDHREAIAERRRENINRETAGARRTELRRYFAGGRLIAATAELVLVLTNKTPQAASAMHRLRSRFFHLELRNMRARPNAEGHRNRRFENPWRGGGGRNQLSAPATAWPSGT